VPVSPHLSRWLVALVLIPVFLVLLLAGPWYVIDPVVFLLGAAALIEFYRMVFKPMPWPLVIIGLAGLGLILWGARFPFAGSDALMFALALWPGWLYVLLRYQALGRTFHYLGLFSLGHVYVSLLVSFFIRLIALADGRLWIVFVAAVTFGADTAAFYMGRNLGRHHLYPAVSPNKTVEGLVGGLVGGGLIALVFVLLFLPGRLTWVEASALGAVLGLGAAAGDLFESMLKRVAEVKDSGQLLMGHGGVLDRLDALLFNTPLMVLYLTLFKG